MLPDPFKERLIKSHHTKDMEIVFLQISRAARPQTVLLEGSGVRPKILMALPKGDWRSDHAAHEFAHVLQLVNGEHHHKTPEELEEDANVFENLYQGIWRETPKAVTSTVGS